VSLGARDTALAHTVGIGNAAVGVADKRVRAGEVRRDNTGKGWGIAVCCRAAAGGGEACLVCGVEEVLAD